MAWRIYREVIRGEIDNRVRGKVKGRFWLLGMQTPVHLDLEGNACKDLAGCLLTFVNPNPEGGNSDTLARSQQGVCGKMTASHKVRHPPRSGDDEAPTAALVSEKGKLSNCLYLEWFSQQNGRVVLEGFGFDLKLSDRCWNLTEEEEDEWNTQREEAISQFMEEAASEMNKGGNAGPGCDDDAAESDAFVDQILRISDLKYRAEQLCDGAVIESASEPLPLDVEEQFWQSVVDFESAPMIRRRDLLAQAGVFPPEPETLTEQEVTTELWSLIKALEHRGMFLDCTNHLSDRELYSLLVDRVLEEETADVPKGSGWHSHILVYEYGMPGDEDGQQTYLRYYADEAARRQWIDDFPEIELPPSESPPFDRDSKLPKGDNNF